MQGWIKVHRRLLDWEWYQDMPTKSVFLHLLLTANHEPQRWRGQVLERGTCVTSIHSLADACGLSDKQVRRAISNLLSTGEIEKKRTNKNTIVMVLGYAKYQGLVDDCGQTKGTSEVTSQVTSQVNLQGNPLYKQECKNERMREGRARASACTPAKLYGDFKNVRLTDEELAKLQKQFPLDWQRLIKNLSFHIHNTHKTYYDHFSVLQKWGTEDRKSSGALQSPPSYDLEQIKRDTMNNTDIKF